MPRPNTRDYEQLFLHDLPLMDTRAPVEFAQGAFPSAHSLPLMSDDERAQVGTCYKRHGQEAAIRLGHQLVQGETKAARLAAWKAFVAAHPEGYLYCFRGGLRSHTVQRWLADEGIDYPLVEGGYKAMRRYLIGVIEQQAAERPLLILGGRTGTGKTKVIDRVDACIDLEGLAHHRGSSFGRRVREQPTQIGFENALAVALLKQRQAVHGALMLEDESRLIGRLSLPLELHQAMLRSPLVLLEVPFETRVDTVLEDYVVDLCAEYVGAFGEEEGRRRYADYMLASLDRIRKRLGGERHGEIAALMAAALEAQMSHGDLSLHRVWIERLLAQYYDPMYDYQLGKKLDRVVFRGDRDAICDWFENYRSSPSLPGG
ncbi:tRNA 2-selenouridine(34) synthase MnmH [Motiliproteus sediminis]|uniref:tRNA 2-selenouridine(34) synthase MnmH n=1 Tax=Motiliproteus sediminis TaxID=1468178 RepID=UPI001AEF6A39|nr:tRNA 2-selenouridine(34) synthase MnmH [Motiliproteus sediminis]